MKSSWNLFGILILALALIPLAHNSTSRFVEIAFVGDVMLGRGVASVHSEDDWDTALASISPILRSADLAVANLESPLTFSPLVRETYDLRAPLGSADALRSAGLDLVSLANNHILDSGEPGLIDTRDALLRRGMTPIGPSMDPVWITLKGYRLAFLACEDVTQPADFNRLIDIIHEIRSKADFIVLSVHWGLEYAPAPTDRERSLANEIVEAGVDLIVGHHPHVLQETSWIYSEGENRKAFVAYSLGNALFDQPSPPSTRQSAVLVVRLGKGGVTRVDAVPFQINYQEARIEPASDSASSAILGRLALPQ